MTKVGVFVNHLPDEISRIADHVGLNCIQLHGDEPPNIMEQLPTAISIVRAWQSSSEELESLVVHLALCRLTGRTPMRCCLIPLATADSAALANSADWDVIAAHRPTFGETPLILAGGLTPENVGAAIAAVKPAGVDVASGVELRPGIKSHERMQRFIATAQQAFVSI